jgi:hypothetical protein
VARGTVPKILENDIVHIGKYQFPHHAILSNPQSLGSILRRANAVNQTGAYRSVSKGPKEAWLRRRLDQREKGEREKAGERRKGRRKGPFQSCSAPKLPCGKIGAVRLRGLYRGGYAQDLFRV